MPQVHFQVGKEVHVLSGSERQQGACRPRSKRAYIMESRPINLAFAYQPKLPGTTSAADTVCTELKYNMYGTTDV